MQQINLPSPIENLELLSKQIVEGFLIGLHKSPFHGFSVEFAEHRLYNPGDNLKHVDWKIYGRREKMFVKKFEEETNLRCCLAIDTSSSMYFKGSKHSKIEFSSLLAASLSVLMNKQRDACSLALFDEHLYYLNPPKTGKKQQQVIINELEQVIKKEPKQKQTNFAQSIHELAERLHQRSLVIIFSDLPENPKEGEAFLSALQHLRYNKHEVIIFHVLEKAQEMDLEFENRPYTFEDMETGETVKLNPEEYKSTYLKSMKEYNDYLKEQCFSYKIDLIPCDVNENPSIILSTYLAKRNKLM